MDDALITAREAADRAGVTPGFLATKRHLRTGPAYVKRGSRVFYRTGVIDEWAERYWAAAQPEPGLLSPARAAELIGVSRATVLRMGDDGRLTPVRTTHGRRYRRAEVEKRAALHRSGQGKLGFQQVAEIAGITEHAVRWHVCRGTGPEGEHIGGRWLTTPEEARRWAVERPRRKKARPLYTLAQTVVHTGLSKARLREMRAGGVGPEFITRGRHVLYVAESVESWVRSRKGGSEAMSLADELLRLLG